MTDTAARPSEAQAPIPFDNQFARELPEAGVPAQALPSPAPTWLHFNAPLAQELGLDVERLGGAQGLDWFSGRLAVPGSQPLAQAYAGHQFGGFSPQLGDGRALLLGDAITPQGRRYDLAFKGSGPTAFARRGDGKAAVGPVLREVLMGEALHALGLPTTRVLAAVRTGESVRRERLLPGAMLTRVAASHLRVGTFEFFAARQDHALLRRVLDHALRRHDPDLLALGPGPDQVLAFLEHVQQRQARLVAQWMGIGFIHGVMNTDNMTISGETIDFGPCALMEAYEPEAVFSSIDQHGRYAYRAQPGIAQWNLARLAESLLSLMCEEDERAIELASAQLQRFPAQFAEAWRAVFLAKLGLRVGPHSSPDDALVQDFLDLLQQARADFTLGFHALADLLPAARQAADAPGLHPLIADAPAWLAWRQRWHAALIGQGDAPEQQRERLLRTNPWIVPRNHQVEAALAAASDQGDLAPFERLLAALRQPFAHDVALSDLAQAAPIEFTARYQTFCGT